MFAQSPEDLELREKLCLMVERAKDSDAGIAKAALDSMRFQTLCCKQCACEQNAVSCVRVVRGVSNRQVNNSLCRDEIRESTSSMTSVPKPLKFLRAHYPGMKEFFDDMMDSEHKKAFSEVLSVLGMTMAGCDVCPALPFCVTVSCNRLTPTLLCSSDSRESLKYKLSGVKGGLDTWGGEYVKNLAGEIGQEWAQRKTAEKDTADLKALVDEIVPFNVKNGSEPEACDLLMEVDLLPMVIFVGPHVSNCLGGFESAKAAPQTSQGRFWTTL